MKQTESRIQQEAKLRLAIAKPGLVSFAIPNGHLRDPATAARLKREGVRPGVPDDFTPYARHGYHGLFTEFKSEKGVLSSLQKSFKDFVEAEGYLFEVVKDAKRYVDLQTWYVGPDYRPLFFYGEK